jgi:hypothetical protein
VFMGTDREKIMGGQEQIGFVYNLGNPLDRYQDETRRAKVISG